MNFFYSFRLSMLLLILAVGSRVNAQNPFITTTDFNEIVYVTKTGAGDFTGSSWSNAFSSLQDALNIPGDHQIWIAGGVYAGNFTINNRVYIRGHFAGTETSPEQRDMTDGNETILDGNNNGTVVKISSSADNSFIEGVTIRNGNGMLDGHIFKGGGIYSDATLTIANSTIRHNEVKGPDGTVATADGYEAMGGGIYSNASIKIMNSSVVNNAAKGGNGYTQNGEMGNGGDGEGGAIYGNSDVDIINSTIAHNTTQGGIGFQDGFGRYSVDASGTVTVTTSIIWDEVKDETNAQNSLILFESNTDNGNIAFDGLDVADIFEDFYGGDYALIVNSPAIDAGNNTLYSDAGGDLQNDVDLAGNPRLFGMNIDMGAYENQGVDVRPNGNNIIYVNKNITGGNQSGDSWANAIPELRDALNWAKANEGDQFDEDNPLQIWVAEGVYTPTDDGDRSKSFSLVNNVAVYGGFAGNESNLKDRDWETNATVLSGDLNDDDNNGGDNSENSYNVFFHANNGLDVTAILDGFVVTGGNANENDIYSAGGGMYNDHSSPTLTNVMISGNTTDGSGGGVYSGGSSPTLTNVTISGNTAGTNGGGMVNVSFSSPMLTNVMIKDNVSKSFGGMINAVSSPTLTNVLISDNVAETVGGMANISSSSPILTNVTISGNTGTVNYGGIYNDNSSAPILYNTIVLGNSTGIWNDNGSISGSNNLIQTGDETLGGSSDGIEPEIEHTTPADIFTDFAHRDYTLKAGSYAVDAGDNALYNLVGDVDNDGDLAGNERLAGSSIDLGAYEFDSRPLPIQLISFDAVNRGDNALLQWSTATESNNKGFYVEHSTDGNNWNDVTFVATKAQGGNSQSLLSYSYTDVNPGSGQHFYRLRQVDLDGAFGYSDVRVVVFDSRSDISIYPNPVRSSVTISGLGDGTYKLSLMNSAGQVINQYKVQSQSQFRIDMSGLASGVYYVQIADEQGKMESKKVVKQ